MSCCQTSCCSTAPAKPAPTNSSCCASSAPAHTSCCASAPAKATSCASDPAQASTKSSCCVPASTESSCCAPASTESSCCATACCDANALKERVRADYALVATVSATNADAVATRFGYSLDELSSIPAGSNLGVSCGNPLALTNVKPGEVVVDLGSGGGLDCFLASSKVGPTGKVYGIDMTPEMLAKAKDNAAKRNITNVEFVKGEIEAIPLPNAVADLVISNCVINLVPDKQKAFAEIYRILKPGGRLAISDIVLKKDFPPELKSNVGMFSACFTGAMPLSDVPKFLESAGFSGILVNDAQVDLNAYKELGSGSGCCGSLPTAHPITQSLSGIDLNEYASSAKIFALK